jgi:hypothetical protein
MWQLCSSAASWGLPASGDLLCTVSTGIIVTTQKRHGMHGCRLLLCCAVKCILGAPCPWLHCVVVTWFAAVLCVGSVGWRLAVLAILIGPADVILLRRFAVACLPGRYSVRAPVGVAIILQLFCFVVLFCGCVVCRRGCD